MTDTVVDSLVVLLKLDPRQYTDEQQKFLRSMSATRDAAASTARDLESRGAQGALFFDQISSSALKLGAILVGGVGLKDFIQNTTASAAAAGRFATNIGIDVGQLSLWQNAIRQMGGDINQVGPALLGLSQSLTTIALRGPGSSDLLATFQALGVSLTDAEGHIKTVDQLLQELHNAFQKLPPNVAYNLGSAIGLTPDFINLLEQSDPAYQKYIQNARNAGTITKEQAQDFAALQSEWATFVSSLESGGREVLDEFAPAATWLLEWVNKMLAAMHSSNGSTLGADIGTFVGGLLGIPFGPVGIVAGAAIGAGVGLGAQDLLAKPTSAGGGTDLFSLFQKLEGTPDGRPSSAGAIGRNQILPSTAKQYGFDPSRLSEPAYNDMVARTIEADLNARYHGDLDAIAIAYHNGPGAADRFLASGRSLAGFGPQTLAYVAKERALTGGGHTAVQIDQINVNTSAPSLTGVGSDVGAGIRSALASNALVSQGNAGPQ